MKTVLITGANRGLGLAHAERFAAAGAKVFAGVQEDTEEMNALVRQSDGRVIPFHYEALSDDVAGPARSVVKDTPLDFVFANAGMFRKSPEDVRGIDVGNFMETVRVNALAPLILVDALIQNVALSERKIIAFQSSNMGSISTAMPGWFSYTASKAALNRLANGLANELRPIVISVVFLHPVFASNLLGC
jgi:NAD(P)-dependent dehydrogenase (short-subunit alcohol dehydrogenase family)